MSCFRIVPVLWKAVFAALLVCGLQLYAQQTVLTVAEAAAKAASYREAHPLAAIPDQKASGTFQEIRFPGADGTVLEGINPRGDIVGIYQDASRNLHNFLLSRGIFTNIDPPGGQGPPVLSLATQIGINPRGDIVGNYLDSSGNEHGFLLSKGTYTNIDAPGAIGGTWASGINPQGDIVGFYVDSSGGVHGFLLSRGTYTNIDVPGALGAAPGTTVVSGINPQGDILGFYNDFSGNTHGFLLSHGTVTAIDVPGSTFTVPYGINPQDDIVGLYFVSGDNNLHGFLLEKK